MILECREAWPMLVGWKALPFDGAGGPPASEISPSWRESAERFEKKTTKRRSPQASVVLHSRSMNWVRDFRLDGSRRFPSKMFYQTKLPGDFSKFQPKHKFPGNRQSRHASIACRARATMCNLLTRMSISQRNGPPRALPPSEWTISKSDRGNATRNRTLEHFCSCCNADIALSHPSYARIEGTQTLRYL